MTVVSDSSPLINMARLGQLDLLRQLYAELVVPQAVWDEIVIQGEGQPGATEIKAARWVRVHNVSNSQLVRALRQELDAGEAEAIALAIEAGAEILLIDERLARESAQSMGVPYVGLIGVLIRAKHAGLITAIKPYLDQLRDEIGFRISESLYQRVLLDQHEQRGN